jgi:hypothetical protein
LCVRRIGREGGSLVIVDFIMSKSWGAWAVSFVFASIWICARTDPVTE